MNYKDLEAKLDELIALQRRENELLREEAKTPLQRMQEWWAYQKARAEHCEG